MTCDLRIIVAISFCAAKASVCAAVPSAVGLELSAAGAGGMKAAGKGMAVNDGCETLKMEAKWTETLG